MSEEVAIFTCAVFGHTEGLLELQSVCPSARVQLRRCSNQIEIGQSRVKSSPSPVDPDSLGFALVKEDKPQLPHRPPPDGARVFGLTSQFPQSLGLTERVSSQPVQTDNDQCRAHWRFRDLDTGAVSRRHLAACCPILLDDQPSQSPRTPLSLTCNTSPDCELQEVQLGRGRMLLGPASLAYCRRRSELEKRKEVSVQKQQDLGSGRKKLARGFPSPARVVTLPSHTSRPATLRDLDRLSLA
ncbi:hypothetical protein PG990_004308 [Apiospora arundinis]